jgi:DNA mismatch repair protein MutL
MLNHIKLLPDSVANQIAAGEVIQRPASAVKEMLENSVDAGATEINLFIKDAGKTLIQVTDNGCGMSALDARMCFERHATSKISKAEDLFSIHTLGFRGEAMASIAAIAQVEVKTKPADDEIGTCLRIEGSKVISQEPCPCQKGTSLLVKNLFFNVPARRNFLKSNNAETRHILEEFNRVALINPKISFGLVHNDKVVYKLPGGSLKSRIVGIFGKVYDERLLPVSQKTDILSISGFIVKPEYSKKTRGEQYFFVNNRFIKHPYLNHAVANAFSELMPADAFPSFFIHIEVDPADIDINIHPTKTEVNFKDARYVYAVLHAAVKQSVGMHNLTPTLDFNVDQGIDVAFQTAPGAEIKAPQIHVDPEYNPFKSNQKTDPGQGFHPKHTSNQHWEAFFKEEDKESAPQSAGSFVSPNLDAEQQPTTFFQIHNRLIACNVRSGMMLIDQQKAHERILYEHFLALLSGNQQASQQQLFPHELYFSQEDISIVTEIKPLLTRLGYMLEDFGPNRMVVKGIPAGTDEQNVQANLELIIEDYKKFSKTPGKSKNIKLARAMAVQMAVKAGTKLSNEEMADLFDRLFACEMPDTAPDGSKTIGIVGLDELVNFMK